MPDTNLNLERAVGKVSGQLEDVIRRLDKAEEARGRMYSRFERHNAEVADLRHHMDARIGALDARVAQIEKQIEKVVIVVDRATMLETQGRAVVAVGTRVFGVVRGAIIAAFIALAAFWREILAVIRGG